MKNSLLGALFICVVIVQKQKGTLKKSGFKDRNLSKRVS